MPDQILAAAAELFRLRGYHAVGIRELADAVGLSTSTLYHYYRTKQDILFAIIDGFLTEFADRLVPILRDPGLTPTERLERIVTEHLELTVRRSKELLTGDPVLNAMTPEQQAAITELRRRYRDAVRDVLVEGNAAGEFSVTDPLLTAMAMLDMLDGVRVWYHPDGPLPLDDVVAGYLRYTLALARSGTLP
jgi:AcrR family transcriptional regulator